MRQHVMGWVCLSIVVLAASPSAARTDAVLKWNENAGRAATAACLNPDGNALAEARMYAMVQIAVHDAVNAIQRRSRPYAYDVLAPGGTSSSAAVAAAARDVLVAVIGQLQEPGECVPRGLATVEADYAAALGEIPNNQPKARGIAVGQAAARAILELRANDGSDTVLAEFGYPEGSAPGEFKFVPGIPFAFAPRWGEVTPFVLSNSAQFRAGPPLPLGSSDYAEDFNEVKSLGGDGVTTQSTRTAAQTEIALFWVESSPLAWNRIARGISERANLDLNANARLFGLLNMALADGYIGSWEGKYHYNFWRPVTAIHEADTDGNPQTLADPNWTPLHFTYPMPDHDSAHAVEGGAAAEVLKRVFGTDRIRFRNCSMTLPAGQTCNDARPKLRSFRSFTDAANENGFSRILVGIHFRRAVDEGIEHGRNIGRWAVERFMRPVDD